VVTNRIGAPLDLFELSRHDPEGIRILTMDRGVFPEDSVRLQHPLEPPSYLDSSADLRRVRAFTVAALEDAALVGHTLLPGEKVIEQIAAYPVRPPCPVTADMLAIRAKDMVPEIAPVNTAGSLALQLDRYRTIGELTRKHVLGCVAGQRHKLDRDWAALLKSKFGPASDEEDKRGRSFNGAAFR
jgi:hypothetical protein